MKFLVRICFLVLLFSTSFSAAWNLFEKREPQINPIYVNKTTAKEAIITATPHAEIPLCRQNSDATAADWVRAEWYWIASIFLLVAVNIIFVTLFIQERKNNQGIMDECPKFRGSPRQSDIESHMNFNASNVRVPRANSSDKKDDAGSGPSGIGGNGDASGNNRTDGNHSSPTNKNLESVAEVEVTQNEEQRDNYY